MNTSWSIRLKKRNEKRRVLVGLDGGVPVIVQGYGSILLSPDWREPPGKKGGNTKRFRPFVSEDHLQKGFFVFFSGQNHVLAHKTAYLGGEWRMK